MSENSAKRPRPRRRQSRWMWPRWLVVTMVCLVLALLAAVISFSINPQDQTLESAQPTPIPTETYTTFVPQMPAECYDMLEAADTLYDTSTTNEQQLLKIADLAVKGAQQGNADKLLEAGKTIEKAQSLTPKLQKARTKFLDQYRKCADR